MFMQFLLAMIRARFVVLIIAGIWAIAGLWIALRTPIDALPDLSENQILVYTPWPGHNPPEIQTRVTRPLSEALAGIPGVATVRGSSDVGFSLLHFIFDDSVRFDEARRRVAERLATVQVALPSAVVPQLAPEGIPTGQIVWYTLTGRDTDLVELRRWQDEVVAPQLQELSGVAEVATVGGFQEELCVAADGAALARAGISLAELDRQLQRWAGTSVNSSQPGPSERLLGQVHALEEFPVVTPGGETIRLAELSEVSLRPRPRYGVFEKDGSEMVAGVVHLQAGANPLQVTREVLVKLQKIGDQLPGRFRVSPCYDRTRLISGSVATVTRTLIEALLVTTLGIVLIMRHIRTSLVIAITLPLAVLGAFIGMRVITEAGWSLHTNIMSLAGIAISIGVLVDASVVIVENVTHQLKGRFGDRPVAGNTDRLVAQATAMVARPAVLAILIMLVSFLPIFALRGIDGHMYRPLAWTKTLTLLSVILLTVTVVPGLCRLLIRGHLRSEHDSSIMRAVMRVYRPVLMYLFDRPWPLLAMLGCLLIAAAAATGLSWLVQLATLSVVAASWWMATNMQAKVGLSVLFIALALSAQAAMQPIRLALRLPLDEGMVMDMPITVPRMTISQAADDLKARNMLLCRFPEVQMVTGKAGRADTAFDPAPVDMIETMVEFRPHELWPRRRLLRSDASRYAALVVHELTAAGLVRAAADEQRLVEEIVDVGLQRFNAVQRELCWQILQPFERTLAQELTVAVAGDLSARLHRQDQLDQPLTPTEVSALASLVPIEDQLRLAEQLDASSVHIVVGQLCKGFAETYRRELREVQRALDASRSQLRAQLASVLFDSPPATVAEEIYERSLRPIARKRWRSFVAYQNQTLYARVGRTWTQIVADELCMHQPIVDESFAQTWQQILAARYSTQNSAEAPQAHHGTAAHMASMPSLSKLAIIDPHHVYDRLMNAMAERCGRGVWLWPHDQESLAGPAGELDAAVQMPGWANVWTRPIQNRIDMLATGINSEVGVRVLGDDQKVIVGASEKIAEVLRAIPGASDVIADPIRDKDYTLPRIDFKRIASERLNEAEVRLAIEAALNGHVVESGGPDLSVDIGQAIPVRLLLRPAGDARRASLLDTPLPLRPATLAGDAASDADVKLLPMREVAELHFEVGPATIKSTGGRLCNYVRLNVVDRDPAEWVREAQATLERSSLPAGVSIEWTGQFEHAARTRKAMLWIVPGCIALILVLLFGAFRDVADALLMLLAVPGALAGAVLMQWLLGFPFSLAVGVGYITCFGMAAATSTVMLVYLRQAVTDAGGLANMTSLAELQNCVVSGAVHRLRPKLLTEATMILGLAPLMWNTGIGADVIRPMAAPVLGGILVADEVVDLLIPVMFFAIRRWRWKRLASLNTKAAA